MPILFYLSRYFKNGIVQWMLLVLSIAFSSLVNAVTYNLTSGSYPPCNTSWSVSGTTYTCTGNGRVTLGSGDILTANTTITISADDGFVMSNNTIGSSTNRINLVANYGAIQSGNTNTIYGNITSSSSSNITLINTSVTGTITTRGIINLTGGTVTGKVTSIDSTITTSSTNLGDGAQAQSGVSITGGTLVGNVVLTANNPATFSGVTMTSGSITGASVVTIQSGSVLGSGSSSITITSTSGPVTVDNAVVYGNLTAPSYSTINVSNGGAVYGTCVPGSTPANACSGAPLPPTPMNCTAGTGSGITGNYYNNTALNAPVMGRRTDAPINFNWGTASPGLGGITVDNFSARWSGYVRVTQTGAYRFQTDSDDGVRLYINGNLAINNWTNHATTTDTSTDINLVAGNTYTITLEYYESGGGAVIALRWRLPGAGSYVAIPGGPLPTMGAGLYECLPEPVTPVASCGTGLTAGITGSYFNNSTLTPPVTSTRSDAPINFDWGTGAPGPSGIGTNSFSARWDGYVHVAQSGLHQFQTNSDDGVRLTVNGALLIDQWNAHAATVHTSAAVNLAAGTSYPIKLEYYENSGSAVIQLRWQTPAGGSYVAIPRGTGSSPISAAGLYECVATPASYIITHNVNGITCAAESVTISARNTAGVVYNPPAGTVVTLSTTPATGVWVGGNTFTFTGNESSFTKYLRQTTPGTLTLTAASPTASSTSTITFVDTVLRIVQNSALANIPTQVAGVNGSVIAKVISTNPKTGVCEAIVASRTLQTGLGFTCNNPTACVGGQTFTVNGSSIAANNNAAAVTYNNVNLTFNANGEAPMTINYSDVGQVTLHGRLRIDALGNNPELTVSTSSNAFVVKPHLLTVSNITNSSNTPTPQTTTSGAGFIPAGEQFKVFVQSRNASGAVTPNFGNETTSEKDAISLTASSLVHPTGGVLTALTNSGSFAASTPAGTFVNSGIQWNQAGSIRITPSLTDNDYLSAGNISNFSDGNLVAGRFYPNHFTLVNPVLTNSSCATFSYMQQPLSLSYSIEARGVANTKLTNYIPAYGTMPTVAYVSENAYSGLNLQRFVDGATHTWAAGALSINSANATFNRLNTNQAPDGPFASLQVGLQLTDSFDSRSMQGLDMNASSTGVCVGLGCNAIKLGSPFNMRYGRLRLDDAFGPETASLPVNFATEFWTGSFFAPNTNDSCTKILRSAISYPAGNILTPANLTVGLTGGSTTGAYGQMTATEVGFVSGSATHSFSAPSGGGTGSFNVTVDLTSYPWLRFDWNQDGTFSDLTLPAARYTFGSYRGHDRVIYWRERF
jgi:MSHA biogenesis protein MshQ